MYNDYYQEKPHAAVIRRKFLEDLAEAQAQSSGQDVKGIYTQLRHREEQRRIGAKVRALKQKSRKFVTEVTAPGVDGSLQKFHTKEDIETQLCQESIRRFSQANNTPCMQPDQISLLGPFADSPISDSILQGSCSPDIPLHSGLRSLLPHLQTPATIQQAGDIDLSISLETYIKGWKKQREDTSSGGDMHFGHFKASIFNPTLADFDRMFLEICLKTGHVLPRWKRATDIMIPKKKTSINVADMRTICLLLADWNFGNKLLSRRIMYHAESCKSIAPEQYGSRKGKSAIQHATNKALLFDLQRQQKHDAVLIVLDAKACYDRVPLHIAALCLRRQGLPLSAIRFMFHPIATTMRHTIPTGYGESTTSYNAQDHQFHGILQGNGAGPCIWVMVSSPLLDHLRCSGLGIERLDPTTGKVTSTPAITFVDDNDVVVSLKPYFSSPTPSITVNRQIPPNLERPQQALTTWTDDLESTAGATQGSKSSWQLLSHHFSSQNRWSLNKLKHSPGDLYLHNTEGAMQLQRKEFNDATLALGIMFSIDGSMKDKIQHLKSQVREWCNVIRTQKLSRYENWYGLNRCILRTLHYPLRATTMSQDKITSIMAPLLQTMLPRSGICRNIYRDALYCKHKHQGFGLPNLWYEQGLLKLMDFLGSDTPNDTTTLMHESHNYTQLESGLGPNFLCYPFTPSLKAICTRGIITSLWEFCDQSGIQLVRNAQDRQHITGDFYLVESWLKLDIDIPTMRDLEVCRLFLQLETASDLLYLSGTGIRYHVWNGVKFQHNERWPVQPRPSEAAWTKWRTWLSELFPVTDTGLLFSIARPINVFGYQEWRWFMSKSQDIVYEYMTPNNFRIYQRILSPLRRTRQDPEFLHDGTYVTKLPDHYYAITTVLVNTNHIMVDSKTEAPQLHEASHSLPTWISSIQHETTGSVNVLRQAALAGELILVSDGSYKGNYATGSFILTTIAHRNSHYVKGSARATGPGHIQDSYRGKLFGLLAGICHLSKLLQSWEMDTMDNINLVIGCDNLSALDVSFDPYWHPSITPYYSHFDVIQSIRSCWPSNLSVTTQHVKGHQDDFGIVEDPLEQLNVRMDQLCKQRRASIESTNDHWTATLPFWKWMINIGNNSVCTNVIPTIKEHLSATRMEHLSASLEITPAASFSSVNWDAIVKAMDTCKPSHCRWVSKHNVGMCGVNKWKFIWGQHHTNKCIQCDATETAQHTYLCQHQSVTTDWDAELLVLDQWLDDANTEPLWYASIMAGIRSVRNTSKVPLANDISAQQNLIGWIPFFEGKHHINWSSQQDLFYKECGSRHSGQRWSANLIKELWQFRRRMWKMRNHREHDNDEQQQRQALIDQIQVLINAGFHNIPRRNRHLHSPQELRRVLTSRNPEYHRSWIRNIQAAQAFTASRQAHQRDYTQRLIPTFFSTHSVAANPTQA